MPLRSRQRGHRGCGCGAIISSVGIGAPPRRLCRQRWSPAASAGWVPPNDERQHPGPLVTGGLNIW